MKKGISLLLTVVLGCTLLCSCGKAPTAATAIVLGDNGITVNGAPVSSQKSEAVYTANDIVYYEQGHDFTYGEGSERDAHSAEEAKKHTVVHITKAGTYRVSGTLSAGQIAVDLGDDADDNPSAVVTLILDNVNLTCTVAPAIIFYEVYECSDDDEDTATHTVNTTAAGANIVLADDSKNTVNGSYVAKIYESYTLNEAGTEVADSDKLHKYDGAVYSRMSLNVGGEQKGDGTLTIAAQNEGLDSERHLTINGGTINIVSENDGINTNEDGISVTTVNGGTLNIAVSPTAVEGDGIDSNGWLVINGGTVNAFACGKSGDAGIDSDNGIYVNGGTVVATGNMLDRLADGDQTFAVFSFSDSQPADTVYTLKNEQGETVVSTTPANTFTQLVISSSTLKAGTYTLYRGETALSVATTNNGGGRPQGGNRPFDNTDEPPFDGNEPPQKPQGDFGERPSFGSETPPEKPEGETPPPFNGNEPPQKPEDGFASSPPASSTDTLYTTTFTLVGGANYFSVAKS